MSGIIALASWLNGRLGRREELPRSGDAARRDFSAMAAKLARYGGLGPVSNNVRSAEQLIAGVPCRLFRPTDAVTPGVIVYFHGGGWVVGASADYSRYCAALADAAGALVVAVDYRLAPEHPAPAAADDCYAVTAWLAQHAGELDADGARLAVAGDSAGGNLAAVVALMARDQGGPTLLQQTLIYPVIDADFATPSYQRNARALGLTREKMRWFWDQYAPDEATRRSPQVSPIRATTLTGLPSALVLTASHDVLRDEGRAYAQALAAAGNTVVHQDAAGMIHGYAFLLGWLPEAQRSLTTVAEHIRRAFSARAPSSRS